MNAASARWTLLHPLTELGPEWRVAAVTLVWCMSSDITPVHSMEALLRWS